MSDKQRASNLSFAIITLVLLGYYELPLAQTATEQLARDQRAALRPQPERGETVTNRPRPELDRLGVHAGGLFIYPRLGLIRRVKTMPINTSSFGKFSFGRNWQNFVRYLDVTQVDSAITGLETLMGSSLSGAYFLDVGCGSGLSSTWLLIN